MRNTFFRQYCSFCWDVDIYKLLTCLCLAVSLGFQAGWQDMCPCCLSLFLTVLVETLTFVGQWLRRVLDVAYLCWRASRTSALSSRPVVAHLLPEHGRSFTSPGFSLCLLSILYTVLCDICIVWAMCDTIAPLLSFQWLAIAGWWYFSPWRSQTDRSQKVDFWTGQSCVGFNWIVLRLYGQFYSFLPDMLPGIYTSYRQFFRKQLNV